MEEERTKTNYQVAYKCDKEDFIVAITETIGYASIC